jgi:hypothetical protein
MSLPSLYNITASMLALMESEEATPEEIEKAFGQLVEKDNRICHFRADLKGEIEKFKAEEKRLAGRRKAMENLVNRLEGFVKESMLALDLPELTVGTFKIALQNNPPSLIADNEKETPNEYLDIIPQQFIPAKERIKSAILAGEQVPGWHVETGKHVRFR